MTLFLKGYNVFRKIIIMLLKENTMKILLGGAQDIGKRDDQQDVFYISTPVFGHTE